MAVNGDDESDRWRDIGGVVMVAATGVAATVLAAAFTGWSWPALVGGSFATACATMVAERRRRHRARGDEAMRRRLGTERRFHEVVDQMSVAVVVFAAVDDGVDFTICELNTAAARMARLKREEILGRRFGEIFPNAGRVGFLPAVQRVWRSAQAEQVAPVHYVDERISIWVACSLFRLSSGEVVVVATDFTVLKEREEELRRARQELELALDASRVGLWSWDAAGRTFRPDVRCAAILELGADEPLSEAVVRAKVHPDDLPELLAEIRRAVEQRCDYEHEYRFRRSDGSWRRVCSRGRPRFDASGTLVQIVGCTWDVTDRRRTEEHLQRAQRLESIGTLAAGVAHDLNNALAPLAMGLDLVHQRCRTDTVAVETVETMRASVRRAASIVAQLVTFTRGASGRAAPVHPEHMLDELRATLVETLPKEIEIRVAAGASSLPVIRTDHAAIHHVLLNLCVNARDAMPNGGTLDVACEAIEVDGPGHAHFPEMKPGRYVVFHVTDTGTGIPAAIRERIFDPFFTTKPVGRGSGLGLSTALGIVQAHRGAIRFETTEGTGTRFTILLPVEPGEAPVEDAPVPAPASGQTGVRRVHGRCVLVVDDEAPIRDLVRKVLERDGYRVLTAADGAEAVAIFARSPEAIDVVLMDLLMPVMNGAVATAAIRRIRADAVVVAASGYAGDSVIEEAHKVGVAGFLAKPYDLASLLEGLRSALASR